MYKDSESTYRDFNLDEYQNSDGWNVDYWSRNDPSVCGTIVMKKRKDAYALAKQEIDRLTGSNGEVP